MARKHPLKPTADRFGGFGTRQAEAFLETQSALTQQLEEASELWFKRVQTEGVLCSELMAKLALAHSVGDAAAAWQYWINRQVDLMREDGKRASDELRDMLNTEYWALTGRSTEH